MIRSRHLLIFNALIFAVAQSLFASLLEADRNGVRQVVLESSSTSASFAFETATDARLMVPEVMADDSARPFTSGTVWAVPAGTRQVNIELLSAEYRNLADGEVAVEMLDEIQNQPLPLVQASNVMVMRGMSIASIVINGLQYDAEQDQFRVCERAEYRITYEFGEFSPRPEIYSKSFHSLLRGVVDNLDEVYPDPASSPEPYLIVTRPAYQGAALDSFMLWRRQIGHDVSVVTTDETGTTNQQIKNYLQNLYDTSDNPPVYVLLIGDVDGANSMPGWIVDGFHTANIITDHLYTMLEGDDYLPDAFIGRFSVDSQSELLTIVNKCLNYERNPFEPEGDWRSRMLITGVRSTPQQFLTYNSAWPTLRWIGDEFLDWGYAEVDTVPYPPGQGSQITNSVNDGVSFVAYRGFGSPSDWAYPHYDLQSMNSINNGQMNPLVTSIVCGGGAFESTTDPCFGELWLRMGTPAAPKGAIGFIGPSELDTKTRWNNTNIAGIYQGILNEGVTTLGAAMLRGKLELFRQFPNNVDIDEANSNTSVPFYFRCFNLLGDPGLNFFVGPVIDLSATIPASVPLGTPTLSVAVTENATPLAGVSATVELNGSIFSKSISDEAGQLVLPVPQTGANVVHVTLTKARHEPVRQSVTISPSANYVAASSYQIIDDGSFGSQGNGDGVPNPAERVAVSAILTNYGSNNFAGGSLHVGSENENASVDSFITLSAMAPGGNHAPVRLLVDIADSARDGAVLNLNWDISSIAAIWLWEDEIFAPNLSVLSVTTNDLEENPEPGEIVDINLEIGNSGRLNMPSSTATMTSDDPRISIIDNFASYGGIPSGSSAFSMGHFHIQLADMYPGEKIPLRIENQAFAGIRQIHYFDLTVGNIEDSDPTAPDSYGYRAYDDGDGNYPEAPSYAWNEIDPTLGGPGQTLPFTDLGEGYDNSYTLDLPFDFMFYGTVYNEVTVCSNGWISFGDTDESFFRNYSLPAIASPNNMVCAFWDDLTTEGGRICTYHDQSGGRFIIEWSQCPNQYGNHPLETFQIVLFDTGCWPTRTGDGDIGIQYLNLSNVDAWDNYATVGIQDRDLNSSLQVSYANESTEGIGLLRSGQAILFSTGRPETGMYLSFDTALIDDDDEGGSEGNGDGIAQNGETVEVILRLANAGDANAPASDGTLRETDSYSVLIDSTVSFPAIPAGETGDSDPFVIQLLPETINGHYVNMTLSLSGGALPCVVLPSFRVGGPFVSLVEMEIMDDNGEFNPGDVIQLRPTIRNDGENVAEGVTIKLRRGNNLVTIQDSVSVAGDVNTGQNVEPNDLFSLTVSNGAANGQEILLTVFMADQYGTSWDAELEYIVSQPIVEYSGVRIEDDAGGNGDGYAQPGETVQVFPILRNLGLGAAANVLMNVATEDPNVTVPTSQLIYGIVSGNSTREPTVPLDMIISSDAEMPHVVRFNFEVSGDGILFGGQFGVFIGEGILYEDFEGEDAVGWSTYGTPGLWHVQDREAVSGSHAFYCGDEGSLRYPAFADAYLRSPSFDFNGVGSLILSTKHDIPDASDHGRIDLQTGPSTYQQLASLTGTVGDWQTLTFSLDGLPSTPEARVRFWLSANANDEGEGWYLDNVLVSGLPVPVGSFIPQIPTQVGLLPNYPNPFNGETTLKYSLPKAGHVTLALYDIQGRLIANLVDKQSEAGVFSVTWRPISMASGIYFARLSTEGLSRIQKLVYLR